MNCPCRIASFVLCCLIVAPAWGQMQGAVNGGGFGGMGVGGFGGVGIPVAHPPEIIEPNSATAQSARASLDVVVELGEIKTELGKLDDVLTERLQLAFFLDPRGIELANRTDQTMITAKLPKLPLRSALRRLLRPHSLRVIVEEEGLVITADFTELTRRGIATDIWVDQNVAARRRIQKALDERVSVDLRNVRLDEAVVEIGKAAGITAVIDRRALEANAVRLNMRLGLRIKNAKLRKVLELVLRRDDLAYRVDDEVLQITTRDAAEQSQVDRIYFLEATGFAIGDSQSISEIIQTSILPEIWDALGGPSTISVVSDGRGSRPALLVSTTLDVHERIDLLLRVMRETHVGADPIASESIKEPARRSNRNQAGGGGMF